MSARHDAARGVLWTAGSQVLRQVFQLLIAAVLFRLLLPDDYGLIRMALVFTGFMGMFRELGLGAAIIQEREVTQLQLSTVFWINVGVGVLLALVTAAAAPLAAWWFQEPMLLAVTAALSFTFVFGSLEIVQRALMRKRLNFKLLALVDVSATLAAGGVGIALAYWLRNVWALVGQNLVLALCTALLLFAGSPWKPSLCFDWRAIAGLMRFSVYAFGSIVLGYFARNLDIFLVATLAGKTAAGLYGAAYTLMLMPVSNVSWTLGNVMFPVYAQLRDDLARARDAYLRSVQSIALLTFPMMLGLMVIAKPFVLCMAREEWSDTAALLMILAVVGMLQSIGTTVGSICYSQGRADLVWRLGLVAVPVIALCLLLGSPWGLYGVATGYTTSQVLLWFYSQSVANRLLALRMGTLLAALAPLLALSLAMAGIVAGARLGLERADITTPWLQVAILVPLGAGTYGLLLWLLRPPIVVEVMRTLIESARRKQG